MRQRMMLVKGVEMRVLPSLSTNVSSWGWYVSGSKGSGSTPTTLVRRTSLAVVVGGIGSYRFALISRGGPASRSWVWGGGRAVSRAWVRGDGRNLAKPSARARGKTRQPDRGDRSPNFSSSLSSSSCSSSLRFSSRELLKPGGRSGSAPSLSASSASGMGSASACTSPSASSPFAAPASSVGAAAGGAAAAASSSESESDPKTFLMSASSPIAAVYVSVRDDLCA